MYSKAQNDSYPAGTYRERRVLRTASSLFRGVIPFGARPAAPAILWLGFGLLAVAASTLGTLGPVIVAALGALSTLLTLRGPWWVRGGAALALAPAALASSSSNLAWLAGGGLIAVLSAANSGPVVLRSHDLKRHLDWCRRRQENAHVLVLQVPVRAMARPAALIEAFRLTDSVTLTTTRGSCELQAVVDDPGFSRVGLERRIVEATGATPKFGWATFPKDGVTLAVLMETARAELGIPDIARDPAKLIHEQSYASA